MIIKYILPIIALGIVIAIHELGHLIFAKFFGVKVEVFSIGIGKKFLTKTVGDTEYALSLIPIGGYCKLKGGDIQNPLKDDDSIDSAHPIKRVLIYFAGPFFNLLLSVVLLSIVFMLPINQIIPPTVLPVLDKSLPAEVSGMIKGDKIISINGTTITNFLDISDHLTSENLNILIERDHKLLNLDVIAGQLNGKYFIGVYPFIPLNVLKSSKKSNILQNDIIIAINDIKVDNVISMNTVINNQANFNITVLRGSNEITLGYTLKEINNLKFTEYQSYNIFKSIFMGFKSSIDMLIKITFLFADLFKTGEVSKSISSPLRLVYDVGNSIDNVYTNSNLLTAIEAFITIIASISLTLGFINLLPIPVLDGGQILFNTITLIKGSPIKTSFIYGYQTIGIIIVLLLFTLGISNDIFYFGDL